MTDQSKRMRSALTDLVITEPFFGPLALRLPLVEADPKTCKTAYTDGTCIGYNAEYVSKLTRAQLKGLICHEVMHVANLHPWREEGREHRRWNKACDYSINQDILDSGMELPEGALVDPAYKGLCAEAVYYKLPEERDDGQFRNKQQGGNQSGKDKNQGGNQQGNDPGGCGETRNAPQSGEDGQSEQEWGAAVEMAAMDAKRQGRLPGSMERLIRAVRIPACKDLIAALMEWASRRDKTDYTWKRPNPRYLSQRLYLPYLDGVTMPPIVAAVDTSGSVSESLLQRYTEALQRVLEEITPERIDIYSCDAQIHGEAATYEPGDTIEGNFPGGGGTDFRPVFDKINSNGEDISGVVYLTDLYGAFPDKTPDYPVLWVVCDPGTQRMKAPFGETIWIE